jgi:hypothetical protein
MKKGTVKGTTRPYQWLSGPELHRHDLYNQWLKARAQARFRGEPWDLTSEEYIELWCEEDRYLNKGRRPDQLCLRRRDLDLGWTLDNVEIISRRQHYQTTNQGRR